MLMNQILDSSNSLRDPDSRSLKRSASVASLPTPPRTHHKHSRSRARSSASHYDSDTGGSELDDDPAGGFAKHSKRVKIARNGESARDDDDCSEDESPDRKRRRTLRVLSGHDEGEDDENAFWTGRGGSAHAEKQEKREADESEECSPSPAVLSYRVKAPVSPPPSRRPPSIQPARASSVERDAPPVTPPRRLFLRALSPAVGLFQAPTKSQAIGIWPERDSPNNPFLVDSTEKIRVPSEWDSTDDEEEVVGEAPEREGTPTPLYEEKPTITYVFRGQKATFHNPLYGLAPEVVAASKLPIDHPDYEAAEACPPKRLFVPSGKRKSRDRSRGNTSTQGVKRSKVRLSEDEHEELSGGEHSGTETEPLKEPCANGSVSAIVPSSKPFCNSIEEHCAREGRERRETAAKLRLAVKDGLRAGAVFAERDEPARRAMGPLRSA